MALRMEDNLPIIDILEQTPPVPETSQWALFLRNHDELTLSMVTDEERDYMYRMYAEADQARLYLGIRRRLAPLLDNDRKSIELLNGLLFSLPGTPVLYYGDEIGLGDNIYLGDRNGVRTPMQWSSDKNAGFSDANPQSLYLPIILDPVYHYEACNVEAQLANPNSLLWSMRRLLALRKRWRALGEGKCKFLQPDNHKILSYVLRFQNETILVVANLSRFAQAVELDLAEFKSCVPVELFGHTEFPAITGQPYFLSLGPHDFYWFSLEQKSVPVPGGADRGMPAVPKLAVRGPWQRLIGPQLEMGFETALIGFLKTQPWFAGNRVAKSLAVLEIILVPLADDSEIFLIFLEVEYTQGNLETYLLPLAFATGAAAEQLRQDSLKCVIAELSATNDEHGGVLYDASANNLFNDALLRLILQRRRLKGLHGSVEALRTSIARRLAGKKSLKMSGEFERSGSAMVIRNTIALRLCHRLEEGVNPDLEIGRFLTAKEYAHSLPLAGALEYSGTGRTRFTLAIANTFIPGAKNARDFTLDALSRYYDWVVTWVAQGRVSSASLAETATLIEQDITPEISEAIGPYLESARIIGVRTAELHLALASEPDAAAFAPEPFTTHYQRSLFQSMRNQAVQSFLSLRKQFKTLPADVLPLAQKAVSLEPMIVELYRKVLALPLAARRIRTHGNCQLDQLLWTGKDFVFFNFEGDLQTPFSVRRIKRSPLRDVAGMVGSFYYAAFDDLRQRAERGSIPQDNLPKFESWVNQWTHATSQAFLKAYFKRLDGSGLLPDRNAGLGAMLRAYLLSHLIGELGRELNNISSRVIIPLRAILGLVGESS
jgi:maltose alpha-D-glucosyltransferase / alpha-amylase